MLVALTPVHAAFVSASDSRIVYVGRFDTRDPLAEACEWTASEVRIKLKSAKLVVRTDEQGDNYWQFILDGEDRGPLQFKRGSSEATLNLGRAGVHDVRLVKRTEAFVGTTRFLGYEAPEGSFLKAEVKRRHLEFIGDSITCGYGNEGLNQTEHFKPSTENGYMSYASIAARALKADVSIIAWSGRKMWPDNTMPDIYDLALPTDSRSTYSFRGPVPDAVVINLATNDFGKGNPDEGGWTHAYEAFIRRIWTHYPKAKIIAAIGSMMSDNYPPGQNALTTLRSYLHRIVSEMHDSRLSIIEFPLQDQKDGLGADWHPNLRTHEKMGQQLARYLRTLMNW